LLTASGVAVLEEPLATDSLIMLKITLAIFMDGARSARGLTESISVYTSIAHELAGRCSEQLDLYGLRFRIE
jgi:hypothetical protein